jgi:hypothetical protein
MLKDRTLKTPAGLRAPTELVLLPLYWLALGWVCGRGLRMEVR